MARDGWNEDSPAAADAAKKAAESGAPKKATAGGLKKGPWTSAEDEILAAYVRKNGEGNWNKVQHNTGLARCGKSCRLRWTNHLRPDLKKGSFSREEEEVILRLHRKFGNKWARMALQLPGRTDNEIKNFWNTRMKRLQRAGNPTYPSGVYNPPILSSAPPIGFVPGEPNFTAPVPPPLLDTITFDANPAGGMNAVSPLQVAPYVGQMDFPFSPVGPPPTQTTPFQPPPPPPTQTQTQQMAFSLGSFGSTLPPHSLLLPPFSPNMELPSSQFIYSDPQFQFNDIITAADLHLPDLDDAAIPDEFKLFRPLSDQEIEKDTDWNCTGGGGADGLFRSDDCGGDDAVTDASLLKSFLESDFKLDQFLGSDFVNGFNTKHEPADIPIPMPDDLSAICSAPNPDMLQISDCYNNNDISQISNVQSSVTNVVDNPMFETELFDFPFPITPVDQDWNIDSFPWSNMPGIC